MKKIKLTKGQYVIVDDEDYEKLNRFKWMCNVDGYAVRHEKMHRTIMDAPQGLEVDHINGNRLDNRKENLRIVKKHENGRNRKINRNNTSGYKGVSWHKPTKKWQARIGVNRKMVRLGYFNTPEEAAYAYDEGVKFWYDGFGRTNF